jgi:cell division protein FtsZ
VPGLINLDFADVRTIMSEMGMAMMGAAIALGENRAIEAAQKAISSPLLEDVSIQGARGVLINITGGPSLTLHEVNEAATLIQEEADDDANIIFGAVIDESMGDEVRITVIATGFGERVDERSHRPATTGERTGSANHAPDGRPIRRHGLLAEDELDVPAFQRRGTREAAPANGRSGKPAAKAGTSGGENDDYDIPTFLRRGAD